MDTLKLHSHFMWEEACSLIQVAAFKDCFLKKRCVYMNTCLKRKQVKALKL